MAEDYNWDADERRSRWLRDLLGKSEDESITPEVQVAAIRALIMECQKRGVEQVLKRTRKPLKRWKHIAWVVGVLRIVCAVVLTIKVVRIRYDYSPIITNSLDSLILKMIHQGITLFIFLLIVLIITEFLLLIVCEIQRSAPIAFTYALNFVVVTLIIGIAPFLVAFHSYTFRLVSEMYAIALRRGIYMYADVQRLHLGLECCGFLNRSDWQSAALANVTTLLTNEKIEVLNTFRWVEDCVQKSNGFACRVPYFCCSRSDCHKVPLEGNALARRISKLANHSVVAAAQYFENNIGNTLPEGMYKDACFEVIADILAGSVSSICIWIVPLLILTVVMTVLVIVVLLYNSGQGQLLPYFNRVRSPHCHPLVWVFIQMDKDKEDDDLSDYSLVEDLKNFNIDRDAS
ncbi:hypothetical protein V3C99_001004, partial [Haemonchus contortus]